MAIDPLAQLSPQVVLNKIYPISVLFFLWAFGSVAAQSDSLVLLPTVEISTSPLQIEQPGTLTETWNTNGLTTLPAQSVADFLRNNTGIYLKTYGSGSLATTAIRGASAGQTAVLWNGFQIQSPMLGLLDWSLLPIAFTDEIHLQHGGNGAIWGNGAMGGALLMNNYADYSSNKQLQLSASNGSFGQWSGQAVAKFSKNQWAFGTRAFRQQAKNDFEYKLGNGQPQKRQTNAAMHQTGLLQEVYWRPNNKHQLGFNGWLQSAYRQIPPTTVQTRSLANQKDQAMRSSIHWRYSSGSSLFQIRSCLFLESLLYSDELNAINAPSHFSTNINEIDWQRFFGSKIKVQLTGNQTFIKASIKNYKKAAVRHQSAVFASVRYTSLAWNAQLDLRQEWVNGRLIPITPSLSTERTFSKNIKMGAKIGRNYRLPTLNDLYWSPGGNPELAPESGWAAEVNAQFSLKKPKSILDFKTAMFHRNIQNWIQWLPKEGNAFWSATNIKSVRSRGLENRLYKSWAVGLLKIGINGGYDFTLSTNTKAVVLPRIAEGQQWFYVPKHQGFATAELTWMGFGLQYREMFTGKVNTELGQLPGYNLATTVIDYEGKCLGHSARFFLQIDNFWNKTYRVMERRPMPGRAYQIGMSIQLKN